MQTQNLKLEIPLAIKWLLMLAKGDVTSKMIWNNSTLFARWWALSGALLSVDHDFKDLLSKIVNRNLSVSAINELKSQFGSVHANDMDYLALLQEGLDVLTHLKNDNNWSHLDFQNKISKLLPFLEIFLEHKQNSLSENLLRCKQLLQLSEIEFEIVQVALSMNMAGIPELFSAFLQELKGQESLFWSTILDCSLGDFYKIGDSSILTNIDLIKFERGHKLPGISQDWLTILFDTRPLEELLIEPMDFSRKSGQLASLSAEDIEISGKLIINGLAKNKKGINILMYSNSPLDYKHVVDHICQNNAVSAFKLKESTRAEDYASMTYIAQELLKQDNQTAENSILVIDKPGKALGYTKADLFSILFGKQSSKKDLSEVETTLLTKNAIPCIWVSSGDYLDEDIIALFLFHANLQKAKKSERMAILSKALDNFGLDSATKDKIYALEDVSLFQVETAMNAVELMDIPQPDKRQDFMMQSIKRSLAAMKKETTQKTKECVTQYSTDLINYSGRFSPADILVSLSKIGKGSLCLYGPPGSGKTQFVEFLAQSLGKRLLSKKASDLLSKWVGENEQNIAKMFEEAISDEAILFLDEGDSFLTDRALAQASWEVSKVNELLQHMERFDGIFIIATNLFKSLDAAALRRFTFKLEFLPLSIEQRKQMFITEANIDENKVDPQIMVNWVDELIFMPQLTAGDFSTIKRQSILLDKQLTPSEWIVQLKIEHDLKSNVMSNQEKTRLVY